MMSSRRFAILSGLPVMANASDDHAHVVEDRTADPCKAIDVLLVVNHGRDKDGYFYFKLRLKRMIKSSGVNVYPAQVKDVLRQHPVAVYLNKMKEFT
jgi:acyl-coenzyme A synthetase/AMP-(fatty) acid ligase